MPIYEYRCLDGHTIEKIMSINQMEESKNWDLFCTEKLNKHGGIARDNEGWEYCGLLLEKIWSTPAKLNTPDDSRNSLVYYENAKGEVEWTSTPQQWQPHGFEKKEARNHFERLAVERRIRDQDNRRLSQQREENDLKRHLSEGARHAELRNALNQGEMVVTDPTDTSEEKRKITVKLDERGKDLIRKGMEYSRNKKKKKLDSEFRFSVNHNEKNNIRGEE